MENVWDIITKPDNIPIVALLFMLFFFTGMMLKQAFGNDRQIEKENREEKG